MKKFTKEIQVLLSTALIGTAGIGLLTSCSDDYYNGGLQRTDVTTSERGNDYYDGGLQAGDDLIDDSSTGANAVTDETKDKVCVSTDDLPLVGEMAAPDDWITTEAEETDLPLSEGVAMPD